MRKVKYKKWIIAEYIFKPGSATLKEGTGCCEPEFVNDGIFHQWAAAYEDFENNAGNYTVGLIENPDGTITEVIPSRIMFVEPTILS
jgi:hypothetical protein